MKTIIFATNNTHKLEEVKKILNNKISVLSLNDIKCYDDIPETADTLEGNALQKARYIKDKFGYDCFADDTGLEVEALHNAPGVFSARYAGTDHNAEANMSKLLFELRNKENRKARFRTIIAYIAGDKEYFFEGIIHGIITENKKGNTGFGYDPVFQPDGYDLTFAELGDEIKNKISHRALAVQKLSDFLNTSIYK